MRRRNVPQNILTMIFFSIIATIDSPRWDSKTPKPRYINSIDTIFRCSKQHISIDPILSFVESSSSNVAPVSKKIKTERDVARGEKWTTKLSGEFSVILKDRGRQHVDSLINEIKQKKSWDNWTKQNQRTIHSKVCCYIKMYYVDDKVLLAYTIHSVYDELLFSLCLWACIASLLYRLYSLLKCIFVTKIKFHHVMHTLWTENM